MERSGGWEGGSGGFRVVEVGRISPTYGIRPVCHMSESDPNYPKEVIQS